VVLGRIIVTLQLFFTGFSVREVLLLMAYWKVRDRLFRVFRGAGLSCNPFFQQQ
jgi:hypothetical protein